MEKITREEYMNNSRELHHVYYLQFATSSSYAFINNNIGLKKLLTSNDPHMNDLYKHSNGGHGSWIWDFTPINLTLLRELGEVNTPCVHTCVGKAVAREIVKQHLEN